MDKICSGARQEIEMKVDTGAQLNILSEEDFAGIQSKPALQKTTPKLCGYGG